ncbi:Ig-like domain-containing protein [Sulfurovum sp.]|uniref:Ig-like domain-containing protein n=1 Tax=Sulfurovum sp. TaxID=1969726 RepID=UPI0035666922
MKHFLVLLLFITGSISLYGADDDLSISKGTDQEVIAKLSPTVAQTDVWNNAKIEVSFTVPLDASSVQKNNIKLVHLSSKTNEHIDGTIDYDKFDNKVVYTPSTLLSEGIYEVEIKSLKADKAYKTTQIKEIKYRFYVPEVINGHQLPPEPDPVVNDSTLLGIDANGNGVRDDVERHIIIRFSKEVEFPKTKTAIALQYAKAYQFIMENDPKNAFENKSYKKVDYALDCKWYWYDEATKKFNLSSIEGSIAGTKFRLENKIYDNEYKEKLFNTKLRMKAYFYYNASLSGHMLGGGGGVLSSTKDKCDFDIDVLGELQ